MLVALWLVGFSVVFCGVGGWRRETERNVNIREYYKCMFDRERLSSEHHYRTAHALVVEAGSAVVLSCFDCTSPAAEGVTEARIRWVRTTPRNPHGEIVGYSRNFEESESLVSSESDLDTEVDGVQNLHLPNITADDMGQYICSNRETDELLNYYYVDVVSDLPSRLVIVPTNTTRDEEFSHLMPRGREILPGENLTVFTKWTAWTDCDRCFFSDESVDKDGERSRLGQCMVKRSNATILDDDYLDYIFTAYSEGIPCKSTLLPKRLRDYDSIKNRANEMQTALCSVPCPIGPVAIVQKVIEFGQTVKKRIPANRFSVIRQPPAGPPPVKRLAYRVFHGNETTISCPSYGSARYWRKNITVLNHVALKIKYKNRVRLNYEHSLRFQRVEPEDTGLYSCYSSSSLLLMTAELTVIERDWTAIYKSFSIMFGTFVLFVVLIVIVNRVNAGKTRHANERQLIWAEFLKKEKSELKQQPETEEEGEEDSTPRMHRR